MHLVPTGHRNALSGKIDKMLQVRSMVQNGTQEAGIMNNPLGNWPAFPIGKIVLNKKGKKEFPGGLPKGWEKTKQRFKDMKGNAGIVPGKGRLVIDIDQSKRIQEATACLYSLPATTTQKTQSGGLQAFFYCPDAPEGNMERLSHEAGELRKGNAFCIAPGSQTTNGKKWKLINSVPVATVKWKTVTDAFAPFLQKETYVETEQKGTAVPLKKEPDTSRSAQAILHDTHPGEEERVSCIMKLLAQLRIKQPNTTIDKAYAEICQSIHKRNKWTDYNQIKTEKKTLGVLKKYFGKKNPNVKEKEELQVLNLQDIANIKTRKDAIVPDWINPETINMLYAEAKNYKSLLTNYLVLCLTTKRKFLGMTVKPCRVLLIDNENGQRGLKKNLTGICKPLKIRMSKKVPLYAATGLNLLSKNNMQQVLAFVEKNKIDFVVLDTLRRIGNFDENSSNDINQLWQEIFFPLRKLGCTTLFLHHSAKTYGNSKRTPTYRGSSDLLGGIDCAMHIEKKQKQGAATGTFKLECTDSRTGEPEPINGKIDFSRDNFAFETIEPSEEEEEEKRDKFVLARAFILDYAMSECPTENHRFFRAEIATALKAWNAENDQKNHFSASKMDEALKHLIKVKTLISGGERGEYRLNHADNERIMRWIAPVGFGNALKKTEKTTTKKGDGLKGTETGKS